MAGGRTWARKEHPTPNIQHRTSNAPNPARQSAIRCWMLGVGCSMFCSPPSSLRPLDSLQQEIRQHSFVSLVEVSQPIIDVEFAAAATERGEIFIECFAIAFADHGGIGIQVGATFQIQEAHGPREIEIEF